VAHGDKRHGTLPYTNEPREMNPRPRGNHHPTVKPTDLMRYLCRLVTPPGGIVLDPFTGSGSTGKAATLEGFRFIGIEREAEYVEIAKARIAAVSSPSGQLF
jgi:site-specific DNA-methyltransferase (adenine-specific)